MLIAALAVVLTASDAKLASPGLTGINVTKEVATFYSDHLAQQLALRGLSVMTATEIASLLGLERQKQLLGCSNEATSCMAELADALGTDGIVVGSIGKFDKLFQIDVKVVAASDGRKLALYTGTVRDEREVLAALTAASETLHEQVLKSLGRGASATTGASASGGLRRIWWAPAAVGAVGVVLGVVMFALAGGNYSALRGGGGMPSTLDYAMAKSAYNTGTTEQIVAITSLAVGGVALLAGGAFYLFGGSGGVTPTVSSSGAGVSWWGTLP